MRNALLVFGLSALLLNAQESIEHHCDRFVACEKDLMNLHQACSKNSRNATAVECNLTADFNELGKLMKARVFEFQQCIASENFALSQKDSLEAIEIPIAECQQIDGESEQPRSCWHGVAIVKQRCQKLQPCCPSVKTCIRAGKNSPVTRAVKEKHIVINRKALECRDNMREILRLPHKQSDPLAARARAVLISQGEHFVENVDQLEPFTRPPSESKRLNTAEIKMPMEDKMRTKMQMLVDKLSQIVLNETDQASEDGSNNKMQLKSLKVFRKEQPEESTEPPTTTLPPPITFKKKHKKHRKYPKDSSDIIRDITVQRPHFSFALPNTVNLTHVYEARPQLLQNSTLPPRTYKNLYSRLDEENNDPEEAFKFRKPAPPKEPPTYKVDSAIKSNLATRVIDVIPPTMNNEDAPSILVDFDTDPAIVRPKQFAAVTNQRSAIVLNPDYEAYVSSQDGQWTIGPPEIPTTTSLPISESVQRNKLPSSRGDARLVKLLRRIRLKPEDLQLSMRLKKTRPFEKPATVESSPLFLVDGSTEDSLDIQEIATTTQSTPIQTFPPVDADANQPLFGYRNKVLSIRRKEDMDEQPTTSTTTTSTTAQSIHVQDSDSRQPSVSLLEPTGLLERTTIAYSPPETPEVLVPINWSENVRRAPSLRNLFPPPPIVTSDEAEMLQLKMDLIRNLEEHLERAHYETKHRQRELIRLEEERLVVLRRAREDYVRRNKSTGYCELYSTCSDQLKFLQQECQQESERAASDFFKRKFSSCNAHLWTQYRETEKARLDLLEVFEDCIIDEIATRKATTILSCPADWPLLPMFEDGAECSKKIQLVHEHCTSLGRCCTSLGKCRSEAAKHEFFHKLNNAKRELNKSAQKCKLSSAKKHIDTTVTALPHIENETILPQNTMRLI